MEETHDANVNETNTETVVSNDLGDHVNLELVFGCQTKPDLDSFGAQTNSGVMSITTTKETKMNEDNKNKESTHSTSGKPIPEEFCRIRLDSLMRLKDSTKLLLNVIEEIQSKTHSSDNRSAEKFKLPVIATTSVIADLVDAGILKNLENDAKTMDEIHLKNVDDDCSVYKRLTRKCNCLNRKEYNDFVIHFNEDIKYTTNDFGEIIKNMRILRKFLYMGDGYTKNSLVFLNEGLTKCPHSEKIEIIQGCAHADICNVFDNDSFVTMLIIWPLKYEGFADLTVQNLAARVLYRIAAIEEGRRYLNYNSKIINDIKKILRKTKYPLDKDITEFLTSTLSLLNPSSPKFISSFYCKADEGTINKIINELQYFRIFMTAQEISTNLDVLYKFSESTRGKVYLKTLIPIMLSFFKCLIMEYDNSETNIKIAKILNNLLIKYHEPLPMTKNEKLGYLVSDAETEAIVTKNQIVQNPSLAEIKKFNKIMGVTRASKKSLRFHFNKEFLLSTEYFKSQEKIKQHGIRKSEKEKSYEKIKLQENNKSKSKLKQK